MKIAFCSDIHLEFGPITLENTEGADVLVLAGDILVAKDFGPRILNPGDPSEQVIFLDNHARYHAFLKNVSEQFPHVIYIMGNHEHYNGDFATTMDTLRNEVGFYPNIRLLDKQPAVIGDVTFFGGTMWTNMKNCDPIVLHDVARSMNDYQCVRNSSKPDVIRRGPNKTGEMVQYTSPAKFTTMDAVDDHVAFLNALGETLDSGAYKIVVVSHHAPTMRSINPKYADVINMNYGYASDLSEFILDNPQIRKWIHGHMHHRQEYCVGETVVSANPRGYIGYEAIADSFTLQYMEV